MNTENPMARFAEALAPLGMPDPQSPPGKDCRRPAQMSRLKNFAWGALRLITINSMIVGVHLAALRYMFLLN